MEVQEKEDRSTTWYGNIKKEIKTYGITLQPKNCSKSQWKKHVKSKIAEEVGKEVKERCSGMTKGRIVKNNQHVKKDYLTKTPLVMAKKILKVRMNMNRIPANFKGGTDGECSLCRDGIGYVEHYFSCMVCKELAEAWEVEKKDLLSDDKDKMEKVANFMEKVEILLNPNM